MLHILVIHGSPLIRDALKSLVASGCLSYTVHTSSPCELPAALRGAPPPDLILLDMAPPGALSTLLGIVGSATAARVVGLGFHHPDDVVAALEAGMAGYHPVDGTGDDLRAVIQAVARGEMICSPAVGGALRRRLLELARPCAPAPEALTPREAEILQLVEQGHSNKEIARRLRISVPTVKNHVHHLLEKLGVRRRGQAAARLRAAAPPGTARGGCEPSHESSGR